MKNKNFLSEIIWKNDLTWFTIMAFILPIPSDKQWLSISVYALSFLFIAFSWVMTFKKRYIFNTYMKYLIIPCSLLSFTYSFFDIYGYKLKLLLNVLSLMVVCFYCLYVMVMSYSIFENAEDHYEMEYDPALLDMYNQNHYLRSVYSIMDARNRYSYWYDATIDAYIFSEKMNYSLYADISKNVKISNVSDYVTYLKSNNLDSKSMNHDNLEVFKMFVI